jgi:hypothetical protein
MSRILSKKRTQYSLPSYKEDDDNLSQPTIDVFANVSEPVVLDNVKILKADLQTPLNVSDRFKLNCSSIGQTINFGNTNDTNNVTDNQLVFAPGNTVPNSLDGVVKLTKDGLVLNTKTLFLRAGGGPSGSSNFQTSAADPGHTIKYGASNDGVEINSYNTTMFKVNGVDKFSIGHASVVSQVPITAPNLTSVRVIQQLRLTGDILTTSQSTKINNLTVVTQEGTNAFDSVNNRLSATNSSLTGYYQINFSVELSYCVFQQLEIKKNGTRVAASGEYNSSGSATRFTSCSAMINLGTVGDYVEFFVATSTGVNILSGGSHVSWFKV